MTARRVTGWGIGMKMVAVLLANPVSAQEHQATMAVSGSREFLILRASLRFRLSPSVNNRSSSVHRDSHTQTE